MKIKKEYLDQIAISDKAIKFKPGQLLISMLSRRLKIKIIRYMHDGYQIQYIGYGWGSIDGSIEKATVYDYDLTNYIILS